MHAVLRTIHHDDPSRSRVFRPRPKLRRGAQVRCGPGGEYEVLSTHDQLLGGPHGLSFLGCRFPAEGAYGHLIIAESLKIGARLAREGIVGRYGIDFVVRREPSGRWSPYAIEINLRNGGTTHPFMALQALTDGDYDPDTNEFRSASGEAKYYVATDHLEAPEYARLTPDDLLNLVPRRGLIWQSQPQTGIAFHLLSALAVAGRVGLTAVGNTPAQAEELYAHVKGVVDEESGRSFSQSYAANFSERRLGEVLRIVIRRSWVNRRRAAGGDGPDLSEPSESRDDGR